MGQTLYQYKDEGISIHVEAYFENDKLVVSGYDIGKRVEEYWGDSDYEYTSTVEAEGVSKLYPLLSVPPDAEALLVALAEKFNTNTCYSEYQSFLEQHGIKYQGFSWM